MYLSHGGITPPQQKGQVDNSTELNHIRGVTEEALANAFSGPGQTHISIRPKRIIWRPYSFDGYGRRYFKIEDRHHSIFAWNIAKGMIQGALFDNDEMCGNIVWPNLAIKEAARRYDAYTVMEDPQFRVLPFETLWPIAAHEVLEAQQDPRYAGIVRHW